jgi:hypothetical protein
MAAELEAEFDRELQSPMIESDHLKRVRAFMKKAGQKIGSPVDEPSLRCRRRQAELIAEEAGECIGGLGFVFTWQVDEAAEGFNLVEAVDGALDLRVVSTGVLVMLGLPDVDLQELVDENNLAKFGPGHSWDANGKLIKPDDHEAPDIASAILEIVVENAGFSAEGAKT